MPQAIYNQYVETSIYTSEFDPRNAEQISMRIDTTIKAGLPFLVAVARGNQPKGPKRFVSEKIVGYASLDDWTDQSSIYRYTFELELYVHPGYTSQNIASCLLDRLLEMANTGYNARGGYDYRNDFDYLKTGPSRVIKTIVLSVHKEHGEKTDETSKFLKQFNFSCAGHIAQMGFKLGKVVDLFFYRHTTTEIIDPNGRPTVAR
jgi:L-amino acid N-acyltransferase YncA